MRYVWRLSSEAESLRLSKDKPAEGAYANNNCGVFLEGAIYTSGDFVRASKVQISYLLLKKPLPSFYLLVFCVLLMVACTPQLPDPASLPVVTAVPTLDENDPNTLCQIANDYENRNWPLTIQALEALYRLRVICTDREAIDARLYTAYLAYGTQLEQQGEREAALRAYQTAVQYNSLGREAAVRLERLQVVTPAPLETCEAETLNQAAELTAYKPSNGSFVRIQETSFVLENARYPVYGVNYYPREYPFARFLTQTPLNVVAAEMDIIRSAGINTLRIFLRYEDLFLCPGSGAIPNVDSFTRLDGIFALAAQKQLRVIAVLHQDADLVRYPLYDNPPHIAEQTRFIVERYRSEAALLAWDLRDRGDQDYLSGLFTREKVLTWLADTARLIHRADPNHPLTAGWWEDSWVTEPLVDFVSFQFYGEYEPFRRTMALVRDNVPRKPILLTSIGYSTHLLDEIAQRNLLYQSLEEVSNNRLAGWVIYLAFDFPRDVTCTAPDCPGEERDINRYGLWNTSYFPKLAVDGVKRVTGAP